MRTCYMLCGISGMGKSTFAHQMAGCRSKEVQVISSDDIREELFGDASIQTNGHLVFQELEKRAIFWLNCGYDVYLDATFLTPKARRKFARDRVRKSAEQMVALYAMPDLATALARNQQRERHVPEEVIFRQAKSFKIPQLEEGFDKVQEIHL